MKFLLPQFSVKKPFTVIVAAIIIIMLGVVSFTNMSADLFPSLNLPYALVSTTYIGASPEEVEMVVTKPIEQSMSSIGNIKSVRSVSRENMSMVILEFTQTANMDAAVIEMRESLDMIKAYMPDGVGSPIIMKLNPDMMPVMVLSAAVEGQKINESSRFLENNIIPELESVEGIASVSAAGLLDNEIHVILREEKIEEINKQIMQALMSSMMPEAPLQTNESAGNIKNASSGQAKLIPDQPVQTQTPQMPEIKLTKEMISGILKGQNFSMPAGYITEEGVDYLVRTGDKIKDMEELKKLPVMVLPVPGIEPVLLEDVAEIVMMDNSGDMYSKVNGNDAVILTIQKQTEYATSNIAKSVRAKIDDIKSKNEGVELIPLMDQGEYIDIVVNSITMNLIYGGILAIGILLIFLRDIKPTIVVGFAIPISLVTAFVMMYFSKITLNIVSMGGLALGVGMLVDNSIVVIENIYRMRNEGKSVKEAAVEGAKQVSGAITASTLTTVSVFLPIVFTKGITRQIFADMGLTIAYSLIASLLIALTLVPMIASRIMVRNIKNEHKILDTVKAVYTRILMFSLGRKWIVVVLVLVLLAGSIVGAFRMGTEFFPTSDTNQLSVNVTMPKGTLFTDTAAAADKVTRIISEIDGVETVGASMSGGMFGMGGGMRGRSSGDTVSMYILLKDDRTKSSSEIAQIIRDRTEGSSFEVSVNESGGMDISAMSGGDVSIDVRGRDFDMLEKIAKDIAAVVSGVEGTVEVSDGLDKTVPEIRIIVDKNKSITNGLTVAQVFMEVNKLLKGDTAATELSVGAKDYSIFVEDEEVKEGKTREDVENLIITSPQGKDVAVKDIAEVIEASGFSSINRSSQQRYLTVTARLAEGYNVGKINAQIKEKLSGYQVPEGYKIDMGGEDKMIRDSFKDLFLMLAMAVAFIYLIMVAQFQSLKSPFIVMFTIPLAFTGGFFALMITGKPLSIVAFVGLIILSGVVVNNGIVFVDYINKLRESGMSKKDAIIEAGNHRLRPIIMTALTTIIALSTMSVGVGMGTELVQPMAITAIGGLIYATLLTLVFIPVLYDAFNRKDENAAEKA